MFTNKYLRKYFKKYAIFIIIGVLALVGVDYIQLFIPEFLGKITGVFTEAGELGGFTAEMKQEILQIVLYTTLVAAGMLVGRILWRLAIFHTSKHIEAGLRKEMFEKAERLDVEYFHENTVGTIMSWFTNDVETIEEFFGFGTVMIVDGGFLTVLVIYKMLSYNVPMSLLIFIPLLLIVIWGAIVEKFMSIKWENRQKAFDHLYDFAQESFTGIRVIKAFVKENQQLHAFAKVAKENQDANITFVKIANFFDVIIELIIAGVFVMVIWVGAYFVYQDANGVTPVLFGMSFSYSAKDLVTMLGYFDMIIWPLIALGQIITSYSRSRTSMRRITRFLDAPEVIKDSEDAIDKDDFKGNITFKDFTFTYPGEGKKPWLKHVNLEIKQGETIGIIGKIGCGKTTLANSLLRIYNVDEGQVFIDNEDIMKIKLESLRKAVAYVPQDNFLFSDTIQRNIAFGDVDMDLKEVREAADFACIDEDIMAFPEKYDTVTGERGVTLSGGQKQRVSIARAYVMNSPILIFDDSVSAVDIKTEESILKNIKEKRKGKTTIVVSSRVSTVINLDKIIVLNEGEIEAFDTPSNLHKISPTFRRMFLLQQLEAEKVSRKENPDGGN